MHLYKYKITVTDSKYNKMEFTIDDWVSACKLMADIFAWSDNSIVTSITKVFDEDDF